MTTRPTELGLDVLDDGEFVAHFRETPTGIYVRVRDNAEGHLAGHHIDAEDALRVEQWLERARFLRAAAAGDTFSTIPSNLPSSEWVAAVANRAIDRVCALLGTSLSTRTRGEIVKHALATPPPAGPGGPNEGGPASPREGGYSPDSPGRDEMREGA